MFTWDHSGDILEIDQLSGSDVLEEDESYVTGPDAIVYHETPKTRATCVTDIYGSLRLAYDTVRGEKVSEVSYDVWGKVVASDNAGTSLFIYWSRVL